MKKETWAKLETRPFLFGRAILELAITYLFVSLAIDSGSLMHYALTLIFLTFALRNLFKGIFYKADGKR